METISEKLGIPEEVAIRKLRQYRAEFVLLYMATGTWTRFAEYTRKWLEEDTELKLIAIGQLLIDIIRTKDIYGQLLACLDVGLRNLETTIRDAILGKKGD